MRGAVHTPRIATTSERAKPSHLGLKLNALCKALQTTKTIAEAPARLKKLSLENISLGINFNPKDLLWSTADDATVNDDVPIRSVRQALSEVGLVCDGRVYVLAPQVATNATDGLHAQADTKPFLEAPVRPLSSRLLPFGQQRLSAQRRSPGLK